MKNKEGNKLLSDNNNDIKGEKDNISMSKIPIRKKYRIFNKFNKTDNSSSNNIKDNINNKDISEKDIKNNNDKSNKKEIKFKHNLSFSKTDNDSHKYNESNNDFDNNNNSNNLQKINKYLSLLKADETYFENMKNNFDINLKLKSSVLNNNPSRNFQSKLKPSLTPNENPINKKKENYSRKDSFMSKYNKYKIIPKISRISSGFLGLKFTQRLVKSLWS